jgi:hypothetical protein
LNVNRKVPLDSGMCAVRNLDTMANVHMMCVH